jgi:arginyl-tRNA synthetase
MIRDDIKKLLGNSANIEIPKEKTHGDYSTNVALVLGKDPKKFAETIKSEMFEKIEVAGPGFINFFLAKDYLAKHIEDKIKNIGKGEKINVEFISANPTGYLTLGNGRGGFGGDVLANVLEKAGFKVIREFYVNDRGKQVRDLKEGLYKGENRTAAQIQKENQKFIVKELKIKFDVWFSEKSLYKKKEVDKVLALLKNKKLTYDKDGALWFKTTEFGDDKDRVLRRENGQETYFASDVAYLENKFERGFKKLIIFVGADHHGYVGRIKAAALALGRKKEQVDFMVMQLVNLKEGRMSKRAGVFITLKELVDEVGLDAARFFFLQRAANSHLIFDLELAKKKSQENPVYYVQYAHARICSILSKTKIKPGKIDLKEKAELNLAKQIARFPEIVEDIAKDYQVQRLPQYAIGLAESFHRFYQECQVLTEDKQITGNRLSLVLATQKILKQTLDLMGISAPSKM